MPSPWITTVEGGSRGIDAAEVSRALAILLDPQLPHELRGLHPSWSRSRLVRATDMDGALEAARDLSDSDGVYYTLNPVRPDLGDKAAKVRDITSRRWILVDCDRCKAVEPDAMATEDEKTAARKLADSVVDWLADQGWPVPVMVDSGNGEHLLYRIELPANDHARVLIGKFLKVLAERFRTKDGPTIDTKMIDACRIAKLPGTWVRKGTDTPDRPHRVARLICVPDPIEIVTVEMIDSVVGGTQEAAQSHPWTTTVHADVDRAAAYVRSAIDRELGRLVSAPDGNRNNQLNLGVFAIGQFVGGGHADRADIIRQFADAARRCGLGEDETAKTIESAMAAGMAQPRVLPASVKPGRNGTHHGPTIDPAKPLIDWAKDIKPRKVEWLMPNRIPIGKLTTFAGWGGLGKSFVTMDLASRISRGDEIPGMKGECFEVGNVLILNTEDDPDDTSVPRLIEAGADLDRIAFAKSEVLGQFTLADLRMLDLMLEQLGGARLLVIDPATAHLGSANDHKNAELRALLMPLSLWAMTRRLAVVLVTHVNKPQAGKVDAMARVVGSVAWVNAVRAAVMFARDPEDKGRRLFVPFKSNNSPEQKGLAYRIQPTDDLARVEWLGEVETSADEALNHDNKKEKRGVVASKWLVERFRQRLRWFSDDLFLLGKEEGISRSAIFEAKELLNLPKCDQEIGPGGKRAHVWWVPPNWGPLQSH